MRTFYRRRISILFLLLIAFIFIKAPITRGETNLNLGEFEVKKLLEKEISFQLQRIALQGSTAITLEFSPLKRSHGHSLSMEGWKIALGEEEYLLTSLPLTIPLPESDQEVIFFILKYILHPSASPGHYQGSLTIEDINIALSLELKTWIKMHLDLEVHSIRHLLFKERDLISEVPSYMKIAANTPWKVQGMLTDESPLNQRLKIYFLDGKGNDYHILYPRGTSLDQKPTLLIYGPPTTNKEDYWRTIPFGFRVEDFTRIPAGDLSSSLSFKATPLEDL